VATTGATEDTAGVGLTEPAKERRRWLCQRRSGKAARRVIAGQKPACIAGRGTLTFASGHRETDLLDGGRLGVEVAGELALVDDDDAVGERADLVEVFA